MPKKPGSHRDPWTPKEVGKLRQLARENTPTRVIGIKLERTPAAVQAAAQREGISLKPPNQKPYGTRRK